MELTKRQITILQIAVSVLYDKSMKIATKEWKDDLMDLCDILNQEQANLKNDE